MDARPPVLLSFALAAVVSSCPGRAQSFDPHEAVSRDGKGLESHGAGSLHSGARIKRGYRGDARKLGPGEIDDARASIRAGSPHTRAPAPRTMRNVIGSNDLIRINPATAYPQRAVVNISVQFKVSNTSAAIFPCTGFLISKDTVATSASCVYSFDVFTNRGTWPESALITPGQSRGNLVPFGRCNAVQFYTVKGWINSRSGNEKYDYGAIKLDCTVGLTTGVFGLAVQPDAALKNKSVSANGYHASDQEQGDGRTKSVTARQLEYSADTWRYMKGGPVWGLVDGCNDISCALAIHSGYHGPYNYGLRIVDPVFQNYIKWGGDGGGVIF